MKDKVGDGTDKGIAMSHRAMLIVALAALVIISVFMGINDPPSTALTSDEKLGPFLSPPGPRGLLPIVGRAWRPDFRTPELFWIDNSDKDNSYTVRWNMSQSAYDYVLEEATDAAFTTAQVVYHGPWTWWQVPDPGKTPGRYFYRVKAIGPWGESAWSIVRPVQVWPLFVGMQARWDGKGFLRGDWYDDIGAHLTQDVETLVDSETVKVHAFLWYEPNPRDLQSDEADCYYSITAGHAKSCSEPGDPSWKWGYYWILPYSFALIAGQDTRIDGQVFQVSGPHQGYTAFGQPVRFWELVNRHKFLFWDGGSDVTQYVHPGDITLRYDAGSTRLLLHEDVLRRVYYYREPVNYTVQYVFNLTHSNAFPGSTSIWSEVQVPADLVDKGTHRESDPAGLSDLNGQVR